MKYVKLPIGQPETYCLQAKYFADGDWVGWAKAYLVHFAEVLDALYMCNFIAD